MNGIEISVRNLSKHFGSVCAVDGISFIIKKAGLKGLARAVEGTT